MGTKLVAARLAISAGVTTIITRSSNPGNIIKIARWVQIERALPTPKESPALRPQPDANGGEALENGELAKATASLSLEGVEKPPLHTRFLPALYPMRDRQFWLLHGMTPHGVVYIDAGARMALEEKAGLLPVGVVDVEGTFSQHESVRLVVVERRSTPGLDGRAFEQPGEEVGRALVNYAAHEISRIKGHKSVEIGGLLGYADSEYVAARQCISLFRQTSRPVTPSLDSLEPPAGSGYLTPR